MNTHVDSARVSPDLKVNQSQAPITVEEAAKQVKGLHLFPGFLTEDEGIRESTEHSFRAASLVMFFFPAPVHLLL